MAGECSNGSPCEKGREGMRTKKTASATVSLIILLLGIVLVIKPGGTLNVICRIVGFAFLLAAAVLAVFGFGSREEKKQRAFYFSGAVLAALIGIILIANPKFVISLLPIAVGLFVIVNGAINFMQALSIRKSGKRWGVHMVLAVLTILLGVVIFTNPFSTMELLVRIMCVILIYDGISNLITASRL